MKKLTYSSHPKLALLAITIFATLTTALAPGVTASALARSTTTDNQQTRLQVIISRGDLEIARRLNRLNALTNKINAAPKLSASDKAALNSEVTSTVSALTSLKAKLDGETTVSAAASDVQDIRTEYRVYALVVPKIHLVKLADDQLAVEAKLTTLAGKLQTRINTAKTAGKDVTSLQSQLDDMTAKISAAQAISMKVQSAVIALAPSDYNSDHSVLNGYNTQLKTAHADNVAAFTEAKAIAARLKTL